MPNYEISPRINVIEDIKNIIHNIQENIKNFNEHILKAINDFIDQIKESINSAQQSKIEKLIEEQIHKEIDNKPTQNRRGIAACFEDQKPAMKQLAEDAKQKFIKCGDIGINVAKELAGETRSLIQQCLDLVTKTLMQFGKCLVNIINQKECFNKAIETAKEDAAAIKEAGDKLGNDYKVKIEQAAADFRVCWTGVYDFIYQGVEKIVKDIEVCADVQ